MTDLVLDETNDGHSGTEIQAKPGFNQDYVFQGNAITAGAGGIDGLSGVGSRNGVHGQSDSLTDSGVYGHNTGGGTGVAGLTNGENGPKGTVAGVWGVNQGAGAGVRGSSSGEGVLGEGGTNGVHGESESSTDSGVWGVNRGGGYGVSGSFWLNPDQPVGIGVFGGVLDAELNLRPSRAGVWGTTVRHNTLVDDGDGVLGDGKNGVHGRSRSSTDSGVYGENTNGGTGVAGLTNGENGPKGTVAGVWGVNQGAGAGVRGTGGKTGVLGEGTDAGVLGEGVNGVHGRSKSPTDSGVYGENTGGGTGVAGLTNGENGPKGIVAGVWGVNQGAGAGVRGTGGLGGVFEGSIAPLQLVPSQIPGHPTSGRHSMGELYVDVQGSLWFCIASGTPGTWKRVQLI